MYLKSLEIQGFKSFPDKISLNFDKGLTAVVGPNGSGKSNIGDSVRWVLGEQSTKTLRGNKMEDVIFSGTVARKPMGFAAVTLNIDNTDRTLADMDDEVAVTRKLYRSGESEYMINGRQCRLKDINELFMDTGLGRDGYSIIGQGRIAEIVGAKSSERRDIFEEAAGISKFRYKKNEAERRLSAAQENLVRLTDILSELESRVGPLKEQSRKAERFIQLSEQRKRLEISVWVRRLDDLKEKLDELENKILVSKSEYENLENDIAREEQRLQDGYRKMQECTIKSDELNKRILEEEQASSQKRSDIAVFQNDIKHCEEAILSAKRSIEDSEETRIDLLAQRRDAEKKLGELEKQRKELAGEIEKAEELFNTAEKNAEALGSSVDKTNSELNELYIRRSGLSFAAESAKKLIDDENQRLDSLRKSSSGAESTLDGYRRKQKELEGENESTGKRIEQLQNKLSGLEKLAAARSSSFEKAKADTEGILYELNGKTQRRKILTDLENNMEGFAGSVKNVLRAAKQGRLGGVCGTVGQNITTDPKYAVAIETALGGAVQNIIVENEDIAKRCIRYLKENKGGRATFLPITSVKGNILREQGLDRYEGYIALASELVSYDEKYSGIAASLLGRIAVAEDIDSAAVIAKSCGYRFRIVTLDGQVVNAGGSFTGGSAQKSAGVMTRRHEIEELDKEIKELEGKRDRLSADTERLRAEAGKLRFDTEAARSAITSERNNEVRISAELSTLASLMAQLEGRSESSGRQVTESEQKIKNAQKTIAESEKELEEVDKRIAAAESQLSGGQDDREKLRLERAELSENLSQLRMRDVELGKDIQAQNAEIERIDTSVGYIRSGGKRYTDEIARQNRLIKEKQADIERLNKELETANTGTAGYHQQIAQLQTEHTEQSRLVNEIQKGMKELNTAKEKLSGEMTRLEERSGTLSRESDDIIKQLMEVYQMTRSEAAQEAEALDDLPAAQKELSEVRNRIRGLGSVNVGAIEEYREVSERYEFMSEQIADVQKSKSELERIISDLTSEMCRIFSDSFRVINSNFKSIFTELFGGGKAELILTDPDDVLGSGIEISVAPPGKVIKNLISLSGGEQAFVAIAIYFAILKLRPAPFCILDEIDAALDEVNVRKYAQYLKKFTDTTQFVLVTHRRSAMEEANVLYGVTMQEDGISKLLKMEQVDFQEDIADIQDAE